MDGNFKANHVPMRQQINDVVMGDGKSYFVSQADFVAHLGVAEDDKKVSF